MSKFATRSMDESRLVLTRVEPGFDDDHEMLRRAASIASVALLVACKASAPSASGTSSSASTGTMPPPPYVSPCTAPTFAGNPIGTRCGNLVDTEGRVVFVRGVNARVEGVFDVTWDPTKPPLLPLAPFAAQDATDMRGFGFDALRLPLSWSALEPTMTGGFDESYLANVDAVVAACAAAGVRVLLDLHQDAYSKMLGGDGAPLWAIQPPPATLGPPPNGGNAATDPRAIAAFNTFFGGSAEGTMLQQRFAAMAAHVAARYAKNDAVMGLEIFNEPLADISQLVPFYMVALPAVRAVMPDKIFAFEPNALRNIFDTAPLGQGSLGAGTVYAPHVYTMVFNHQDPASIAAMMKSDLEPSNMSAAAEAASWAAPGVITEYGYDPAQMNAENYFTWQAELEEQYQLSSFLWVWKELAPSYWGCFDYDMTTGALTPRANVKKWLARVRPAAIAGWPKSFSFDRATGAFQLELLSDPKIMAPHLIAVAQVLGSPTKTSCDGHAVASTNADAYGTLSVQCGQGDGQTHTLTVQVAPLP